MWVHERKKIDKINFLPDWYVNKTKNTSSVATIDEDNELHPSVPTLEEQTS